MYLMHSAQRKMENIWVQPKEEEINFKLSTPYGDSFTMKGRSQK